MYNIIEPVKAYLLSHGMEIIVDLLILVIGIWAAKIASNITKKAMISSKVNQTLAVFISNIAYYAVVIFVVLSFLERLGIKTTSFIALIGAAGLAIALALQGSLANFAAGLMIIIFRPFELGDTIEAAGVSGVVEEIQIFSTVLKTADHKRKIIPNSKITSDVISVDIKP
ncbi:MAG: mechanosensitive ion channel domain-containing protein [Candidatus Margulisiibacteriota bacterium]|jgi:small conductance mechanosensitive channel